MKTSHGCLRCGKGFCSVCGEVDVQTTCIVCAVDTTTTIPAPVDDRSFSCRWCKGKYAEMDLLRSRQDMAQDAVKVIAHESRQVKALLENINEAFEEIEKKLKRLNNMGSKLAAFVKAEEAKKL
jgi:hypothetical protein